MKPQHVNNKVVLACPDARPPAYQAVLGLSQAGMLERFVTSTYYNPAALLPRIAQAVASDQWDSWKLILSNRYQPGIPADRVSSFPIVDLALWLEAQGSAHAGTFTVNRNVAKARTIYFDWQLSRIIQRTCPSAVVVFSDVASGITLALCRQRRIPAVLSMVHGEIHEENEVLNHQASTTPEFDSIYLGNGFLDRKALSWLHDRRKRDIALADLIFVPSDHIATRLINNGTCRNKIRVIPYAADTTRFRPPIRKMHGQACTFLFAGGITQRKGILYLLEAWRRIRQPDWTLQLVGPLPCNLGPLTSLLDHVEVLGKVAHGEMPTKMATADVFVFPSLFEGSAVVTYEALASGLPSIVTTAAGSVVRHGVDGFCISPANVNELAHRMAQLGNSPQLRASMSTAARTQALAFGWERYHATVVSELLNLSCAS
jgi:glycosyltransferase involved in cell wall biosynthesis